MVLPPPGCSHHRLATVSLRLLTVQGQLGVWISLNVKFSRISNIFSKLKHAIIVPIKRNTFHAGGGPGTLVVHLAAGVLLLVLSPHLLEPEIVLFLSATCFFSIH